MIATLGIIGTICTIILGIVTAMQSGCEARLKWHEDHEKDLKIAEMNAKLAQARAEKKARNCRRRK